MTNKIEDGDPSAAVQGGASENMNGVSVLSTLLLSVLLKLEDREYRNQPSSTQERGENGTLILPTEEAVVEIDHSKEINQDGDEIDEVLFGREGKRDAEVLPDGDAIPSRHGYTTSMSSSDVFQSSHFSSIKPDFSYERNAATNMRSITEEGIPQDILLTQSGCGDTTHQMKSAYQESAVRIVSEALLRAIANIFINGILRRSLRALNQTISNVTIHMEKWSISTNVSNGNEDEEGIQDGGDYCEMHPTDQTHSLVSEERNQFISTRTSRVSPEWLLRVNKRIAAHQINVDLANMIPPNVGSSCDVSRCSSVSVLSSGDRTLKVKATPPSQSKLLWKMVHMHDSSSASNLKKLPKEDIDSQDDVHGSEMKAHPSDVPLNLTTENAFLLAKLSVGYEKSPTEESCADKKNENISDAEQETTLCDSPIQTDKHFQQADVLSTGHNVTSDIPMTETNVPYEAAEKSQPQTKTRSLPPTASPLIMDVVWRHASYHSNFTAQDMMDLKASYVGGSNRMKQQAQGVVQSALHRAVSSLLVNRVISDSVASLSSKDSLLVDLKSTPSFKKALVGLPGGSIHGFQWFPYLDEPPSGPCKAVPQKRSRQGEDQTKEVSQLQTVDKQQISESSDTYEDARDKFGSSDDLLNRDVKSQIASSEDEFIDAICDEEPKTSDKSIQVSYHENPSYDDERKREPVEVELPMESINFIKDQFNDVKAVVAKYREMLYKTALDEGTGETARIEAKVRSNEEKEQTQDNKNITGGQSLEDRGEDMGHLLAVRTEPRQKVKSEKKRVKEDKTDSAEVGVACTNRSSQVTYKQETTKEITHYKGRERKAGLSSCPEVISADSIYEDSSSEDLDSTPKFGLCEAIDKRKGTGKRKDSPSGKEKTTVPRKLRKGAAKLRTPAGRSRNVTAIREKTTPDGFLPSTPGKRRSKNSPQSKKQSHKSSNKLKSRTPAGKRIAKSAVKQNTPVKIKTDSSPENIPKVKNRISFFEKISRHRTSVKNDSSTSTDSAPRLHMPVKQAVSNLDKLERISAKSAKPKSKLQKHREENEGRKHIDFRHLREKLHGIKKDDYKQRDGTVVGSKDSTESGVDYTPGKGIWTNTAFFEALGKVEEPKAETKTYPARARVILEEGLLDENPGETDEPTARDKGSQHLPVKKEFSSDWSPKADAEEDKKKTSRNKNANNQTLLDQLVSTDDSCISSSRCSDTNMEERADIDPILRPSSERGDCPKTKTKEELNLRTGKENHDEATLPCKSMASEDLLLPVISQGTLAVTELDLRDETDLIQKSFSEISNPEKIKTTDEDVMNSTENRETADRAFSSSDSIQSEDLNTRTLSLSEKQSAEGLSTLTGESETVYVDDPFSPCAGILIENPQIYLADTLSCDQDGERTPDIPNDEDEDLQAEFNLPDVQFHSPSLSRNLDDVSSFNHFQDPLLASSPRPRRNVLSSDDMCSVKSDGADGVTVETDVFQTFRNASFLRACNQDEKLYCSDEDQIIKEDDGDELEMQDHQDKRGATDEMDGNLLDEVKGINKDAHFFACTTKKSSDYPDYQDRGNFTDEKQYTDKEADSPRKKSSDGKIDKKKHWRFHIFRKRKKFHEETKKKALQETGGQISYPESISHEKQPQLLATKDDVVAMATGTKVYDEAETPVSNHLPQVSSQKRKYRFGTLKKIQEA